MAEKREEIRQIKLPAKQKRLELGWSEPEFPPIKRQQASMETERNGGEPESIDRQLQDPEIQRLHAEQERLRIEAERVWFEQERHFAEQARLRSEAESTEPHRYEAKVQQLVVQQQSFEPKKQSEKEENFDEMASAASTPLSDDSSQPPRLAEIPLKAPKQSVSSGVLSRETADFSFSSASSAKNHRTSWVLPAALIFLMLGGTVLGVWFLQTPIMEKSNQTNSFQTQSNQTETNQVISSSSASSPEPTARSTPEINKPPLTALSLKPAAKSLDKPAVAAKPAAKSLEKPALAAKPEASPFKKPTPRLRKIPPKRKRSITIDDILSDQ
jgi:hypothetical protein